MPISPGTMLICQLMPSMMVSVDKFWLPLIDLLNWFPTTPGVSRINASSGSPAGAPAALGAAKLQGKIEQGSLFDLGGHL